MPLANKDFLTVAEHRVLECLADGRTNEEIASLLSVSPNTVHTHVAHILHKLDVSSRRRAGRIFRALEGLDAELSLALQQQDGDLSRGIIDLLQRLDVDSVEEALRLYRSVVTRSG